MSYTKCLIMSSVVIRNHKVTLTLNKPAYVEMCKLELS